MLGSGTAEDPYQVATAEDLNDVRNNLSAYYKQMNDIDLSGYSNWVPIGEDSTTRFSGFYDGNNYKITGLIINRPSKNWVGLFGNVDGSFFTTKLQNINIENASISGSMLTGALIGAIGRGSVFNCSSSGTVISNNEYTGGLIGRVGDVVVNFCHSSCDVTVSDKYYTGGLIGACNNLDSLVINSYATGNVTGQERCGGLIGWFAAATNIDSCYATGNVKCIRSGGGLIGEHSGTISNSYALGDVTGEYAIGGLIGRLHSSKISSNCYSKGLITGNTNVGGFIGYKNETGTLTSCYYDMETSEQSDNDGRGIPKTTLEMKTQSTFSGWDFQTVWAIDSGYPYLQWSKTVYPLQTGKDYVYVIPFPGGTMNFGGKEYKFVDFLERFPKEQHLAAGVSRDYEYGGPLVKYGEQIYGFLASGITDPEAEGGFGTYLPDTKRTVLSLTDRENFVNFYYIYPALPEVEKPVWVKKVITWKDVAGAAAYEVKLFLDTEEQCIDTQLVGPGVQRFDFTYFIESFMPAGNYLCTVQALATEVTRKAIVWVDTEGATSYTVNLYNSDGEIVYTDSVEPGVQTYDFTAIMPELPTGTNYYGVAIPVLPA